MTEKKPIPFLVVTSLSRNNTNFRPAATLGQHLINKIRNAPDPPTKATKTDTSTRHSTPERPERPKAPRILTRSQTNSNLENKNKKRSTRKESPTRLPTRPTTDLRQRLSRRLSPERGHHRLPPQIIRLSSNPMNNTIRTKTPAKKDPTPTKLSKTPEKFQPPNVNRILATRLTSASSPASPKSTPAVSPRKRADTLPSKPPATQGTEPKPRPQPSPKVHLLNRLVHCKENVTSASHWSLPENTYEKQAYRRWYENNVDPGDGKLPKPYKPDAYIFAIKREEEDRELLEVALNLYRLEREPYINNPSLPSPQWMNYAFNLRTYADKVRHNRRLRRPDTYVSATKRPKVIAEPEKPKAPAPPLPDSEPYRPPPPPPPSPSPISWNPPESLPSRAGSAGSITAYPLTPAVSEYIYALKKAVKDPNYKIPSIDTLNHSTAVQIRQEIANLQSSAQTPAAVNWSAPITTSVARPTPSNTPSVQTTLTSAYHKVTEDCNLPVYTRDGNLTVLAETAANASPLIIPPALQVTGQIVFPSSARRIPNYTGPSRVFFPQTLNETHGQYTTTTTKSIGQIEPQVLSLPARKPSGLFESQVVPKTVSLPKANPHSYKNDTIVPSIPRKNLDLPIFHKLTADITPEKPTTAIKTFRLTDKHLAVIKTKEVLEQEIEAFHAIIDDFNNHRENYVDTKSFLARHYILRRSWIYRHRAIASIDLIPPEFHYLAQRNVVTIQRNAGNTTRNGHLYAYLAVRLGLITPKNLQPVYTSFIPIEIIASTQSVIPTIDFSVLQIGSKKTIDIHNEPKWRDDLVSIKIPHFSEDPNTFELTAIELYPSTTTAISDNEPLTNWLTTRLEQIYTTDTNISRTPAATRLLRSRLIQARQTYEKNKQEWFTQDKGPENPPFFEPYYFGLALIFEYIRKLEQTPESCTSPPASKRPATPLATQSSPKVNKFDILSILPKDLAEREQVLNKRIADIRASVDIIEQNYSDPHLTLLPDGLPPAPPVTIPDPSIEILDETSVHPDIHLIQQFKDALHNRQLETICETTAAGLEVDTCPEEQTKEGPDSDNDSIDIDIELDYSSSPEQTEETGLLETPASPIRPDDPEETQDLANRTI